MSGKNNLQTLPLPEDADVHSSSPVNLEIKHFSAQRLIAPNGMELSFVLITPQLAAHWLEKNNCNRRLRISVSDSYARDMQMGNWETIPSAVSFLPDGSLGNAQHTLRAIMKSGHPQWLLVAWNVPKKVIAAMDRGVSRTVTDVGHFLGIEFESRRASIAKICDGGYRDYKQRLTFSESWASYERHKEAVDFAFSLSPVKRDPGINTTTLGIVARAWYTADRERLAKFIEILKSGLIESSEDQAAIRFRDFARTGLLAGGEGGVKETYRRAQAALRHFLARTPITKLYGVEGDIFPIPE